MVIDNEEDWDTEDWGGDEWPEEPEETGTVTCRNCGAEVYEDSSHCPKCGEFLVRDTSVWAGKPGWYLWLAMAGIVAVILALLAL